MNAPQGVILAGGLSRRMGGGDKALLSLAGQSLMARVIFRLSPQVSDLAINANGDVARFSGFGLPVIADANSDFAGPLAGVLAGLDWAARNGASHIVTAAADTPFFPRDLAAQLSAAVDQTHPIALAASMDPKRGMSRHPTFGLWPVSLREDLRASLAEGTRKVVEWTDRHGVAAVPFEAANIDPFFNVNRPEDMMRAEDYLKGKGA